VREALRSLRTLVFGETWIIPAGVACTLALALIARAALPHQVWTGAGGFIVTCLVVATLAQSLRSRA
jgi:hypothetical protein